MVKTVYFNLVFVLALSVLSCKADEKNFEKFSIDKNLSQNDTIKLLSKYPEIKLFSNEKIESKTRTAYIVQHAGILPMDNYKCSTSLKNDTLEILLNNNNGYFGNGISIKVFENSFLINDIDPKTLHGEVKFVKTMPLHQKLIVNKSNFKKNDSIYGFIDYKTKVDSFNKTFRGYFKALIK